MTDHSPLRREEARLLQAAAGDLPVLALMDLSSHTLLHVLTEIERPTRENEDPSADQLKALWFLGMIALRAGRALMLVTAAGYHDQGIGYQRLIDESFHRTKMVCKDASGGYARSWLEGKPLGKPAKLAGQDFWELLSGPTHANARAVYDWLAISNPDGSVSVVAGPERRDALENASLTHAATVTRDIAITIADVAEFPLGTKDRDGSLIAADERYFSAADDSGP